MSQKSRRPRSVAVMAMIAVVAVLAAACSSGSSDKSSGTTATSSEAKEALAASFKGFTGSVPTTPTKPPAGVNAWVISCGQAVPSCATPAAGLEEAAKAVGWDVKVCDGQLNPDGWGTCIDQAASAKADVILPVGLDCASVQKPFEAAAATGVKIIGAGGADCATTGGKQVFATERIELSDTTLIDWWKNAGKVAADYIIGSTDAKAKVLELKFTSTLFGPWLAEGFESEMKTCSGCKIIGTLDIANEDFGSSAGVDKFSAALQKYTDANAVYVPIGGWMSLGFAASVKALNRPDLVVASGFGDASTMDLIRKDGGLTAALGYATEWGAYGSIDEASRILNGEAPVAEGDGYQMVDADHNMPASGDYVGGDADFKNAYLKLWGVS